MVNKNAVNCELVWREVSNYIDGELDPTLHTEMDAHFKSCASCRSVLEGACNVIQLYSDDKMIEETTEEQAIEVPAGYSRRLEKRLAQSIRASRNRWTSWPVWLIPVAALILVGVGLRFAMHKAPVVVHHDVQHDVQHGGVQQSQPANNIPPELAVVVSTDTDSKLFHLAGCHLIHDQNKVRTLTAKEAIEQGYTPCPQCLRKYLNVTRNRGVNTDDDHDVEANAAIRDEER